MKGITNFDQKYLNTSYQLFLLKSSFISEALPFNINLQKSGLRVKQMQKPKQQVWQECKQILVYHNQTPTQKTLYVVGSQYHGTLCHSYSQYESCLQILINVEKKEIRIKQNSWSNQDQDYDNYNYFKKQAKNKQNDPRIIQYVGIPWKALLK